jgi:hypothetical protein
MSADSLGIVRRSGGESYAQGNGLLSWRRGRGHDRRRLLRSGALAMTPALNYRDKADQLQEEAASAPNQLLRDQLTNLAAQYDSLATNLEKALAP